MKQISANITGSFILNGVDLTNTTVSSSIWSGSFSTRVSNLESFSSSLDATFATDAQLAAVSASLNSYTASNNTVVTNLSAATASLNTFTGSAASRLGSIETTTGSLNTASGSAITRLNALEITSGSNITRISALEVASGSAITRLSALETASGSAINRLNSIESTTGSLNVASGSAITRLDALEVASGSAITRLSSLETASGSAITRLSSLETASGSAISRLNSLEVTSGSNITRLTNLENKTGSYATTGSNTFVGGQYFSSSFNPVGFTTTASLYTDGGLRVTKDAYISGTLYLNNVTVFGTQSVAYISSSQLNIGTNIITVNTDTPSVRFGGLAVYDSGSTGLTGSMLWDSQDNQWLYSNPSGSTYDSALFLVGPRNSGAVGSEVGISCNFLSKGNGMHHMTSSGIFENGSVTCIPNTLVVNSNVGINCISPNYRLHVNGCTAVDGNIRMGSGLTSGNSTDPGITVQGYSNAGMYFKNCGVGLGAGSSTKMLFLSNSGSVGIGTEDPVYGNLSIYCVDNTPLSSSLWGTSATSGVTTAIYNGSQCANSVAGLRLITRDSGASIWNIYNVSTGPSVGALAFGNGSGGTGYERLRITDDGITCFACQVCAPVAIFSGCVSIGGADQGYQLDVKRTSTGDSTFDTVANFYKASTHNTGLLLRLKNTIVDLAANNITGGGGPTAGMSFSVSSGGTISTALTLASTGIACFSSTVCAANLISSGQICSVGDNKNLDIGGVAVFRGNGSAYNTHYFTTGASNVAKYIQYNASGTAINQISAGEHSYFNSGCNVGIGTSTPVNKLQIGAMSYPYSGNEFAIGSGTVDFAIDVTATSVDMYSSAAMSFATTTSERLRISSTGIACFSCQICAPVAIFSGCIGIGNTSPLTKLHVNNAVAGAILPYIQGTGLSYNNEGISVAGSNTNNTNIGNGLTLYNNVASVGAYGPVVAWSSMTAGGAYNATYAFITGVYRGAGGDNNWAVGDIIFGTGNSYGASERMRIKDSGNVGIGTTSPSAQLQICSSDGQLKLSGDGRAQMILGTSVRSWQFETSCGVGNVPGCGIGLVEAGYGTRFQISPGGVACFQNTVCVPMLLASGCIGIGTTSPAKPLEIRAGGSNTTPTQIFNGAIVQAIVAGEPQIVFSSNISPSEGIPTSTELARAGIGFAYISAALPSEFSIGIQCTNVCNSNVRFFNGVERMKITSTGIACFACIPQFPGANLICSYTCTFASYCAGCWLGLFAGDNGYNGAYAFTVVGQLSLNGTSLYSMNYSTVPYIHSSTSLGSTNGNDFYALPHTSAGHADNGTLVCFRRARYSGNTPAGNRTEFCMNATYNSSFTATTYVLAWV